MGLPWYCTREDVKRALDSAETARNNDQVDRAIEASSRSVEAQMRRMFYPLQATRYFDWPDRRYPTPWRLWFGEHDAISLTTVVAGGTTLAGTAWLLRPENTGPPFTHLEVDLSSSSAFAAGNTHQRAIAATGLWGYNVDEEAAGSLAAAISSTSATTVDVTDSNAIGVGQIIRVDSERMLVTGKAMLTTGQTLQTTALTASAANVTVNVTAGISYTVGEILLLDSERMLVVDIAGNDLTVKRAWDGTVLAAHNTGVTVFAPRRLTVTRGALGTTAATHSISTSIQRYAVPGLIHNLTVAEALGALGAETAGYARTRTRGTGAGQPVTSSIQDLRDDAYAAHGRKVRTAAV
jgi:hypothetical protein